MSAAPLLGMGALRFFRLDDGVASEDFPGLQGHRAITERGDRRIGSHLRPVGGAEELRYILVRVGRAGPPRRATASGALATLPCHSFLAVFRAGSVPPFGSMAGCSPFRRALPLRRESRGFCYLIGIGEQLPQESDRPEPRIKLRAITSNARRVRTWRPEEGSSHHIGQIGLPAHAGPTLSPLHSRRIRRRRTWREEWGSGLPS